MKFNAQYVGVLALSLILTADGFAAQAVFKAGAAKRDITPQEAVPMGGYARDPGGVRGVGGGDRGAEAAEEGLMAVAESRAGARRTAASQSAPQVKRNETRRELSASARSRSLGTLVLSAEPCDGMQRRRRSKRISFDSSKLGVG